MSKVFIYQFQIYDPLNDNMRTSRRWGTRNAIETIARGVVLQDTKIEIDEAVVQSDIHGLTEINFDPNKRPAGFQTYVSI